MRYRNGLLTQPYVWFSVLFFIFLAGCDKGQVCGVSDSSRCVLNKNTTDEGSGHGKIIADSYIDTLQQVEMEMLIKGPILTASGFSYLPLTFRHYVSNLSMGQTSHNTSIESGESAVAWVKKIDTMLKRANILDPSSVTTTNIDMDDFDVVNYTGEIKVYATFVLPIYNEPSRSLALKVGSFYPPDLSQDTKKQSKINTSFPYGTVPNQNETIATAWDSGNNFYLYFHDDDSVEEIKTEYQVIPQGEQNIIKIYDLTNTVGVAPEVTLVLTKNNAMLASEEIPSSSVTASATDLKSDIENLFLRFGYKVTVNIDAFSSSEYTLTIPANEIGDDFLMLQIFANASTTPKETFKLALVNDSGDIFEPIEFDGEHGTPIVTMNLMPRMLAPK